MDMNYDILSYDELPAGRGRLCSRPMRGGREGLHRRAAIRGAEENPRPSPSRGQHPCLQRDPRPSGRRTRREAGTVHAQTPHEPQQCGAHAPRQGAGRDLILRPKAGPPSRGGGPAVFSDLRYTADVRVSRRPAHEVAAARRWARRPQPDPSSTSPDQALRGDANLIANRAPCR